VNDITCDMTCDGVSIGNAYSTFMRDAQKISKFIYYYPQHLTWCSNKVHAAASEAQLVN